ncbi:protein phosphatase CheZ [Thiomonas sp. FB-Cd]|uniref:protein phosphatase CheZ n=1 Tax=Thiomonas sp. FB-Cd TaxID=1158292 RepID=UPI0004DF4C07|nr:protein phosphatase CheZ [Thiomonas sp. FB-Cd]
MNAPNTTPTLAAAAVLNLREADALLTEGVQRIMRASIDLPGMRHPLQEALHLSEQQAMATLEAVEAAQAELAAIRATNGDFIDSRLDRLDTHLQSIFTSQQGQDLTGQRLKKTITLLQAVEQRIQESLAQLGYAQAAEPPPEGTFNGTRMDQSNVDDLLAELGI